MLAAGGVGVAVVAAVGIAFFAGGGKQRSASEQKQATGRVEPAKHQPAAQEKAQAQAGMKPAAAEKIVVPAEKPAQPEEPAPAPAPSAEKPKSAEKRVAATRPVPAERPVDQKPTAAPKPATYRPVADSARWGELSAPKAEKKPAPAAIPDGKPATDKTQEAAQAFARGNAKLLNGAPTEAIAAFSEALKLNPKDTQSRRGLGMAYAQAGNAAQAVRHLKLYLKASPSAPDRALIQKRIDQLGGR
jgi:tetratricopeptide (TPR) repeat protein